MIVPAGKRREQVAQGPCKSESIFDKLFEKIAIAVEGAPSAPTATPPQGQDDELRRGLDQALGPGSNSPSISGNTPRQMGDVPPHEDVGLGRDGITPSGNTPSGNAPADQFLGPAPVEQEAVDGFAEERQKIRQFLGYQNFGVKMSPGNDGSMKVIVIPPQGQPVDIGGLLEGLQKQVGGQWKGEETPAASSGGPITLEYVPQGMAVPQKIKPPGKK